MIGVYGGKIGVAQPPKAAKNKINRISLIAAIISSLSIPIFQTRAEGNITRFRRLVQKSIDHSQAAQLQKS